MSGIPRLILGLPHLASLPGEESALSTLSKGWQHLIARSRLFRLSPGNPESLCPEAAWLGLNPADWPIPQGPLVVAALRVDPPERSVLMQASLLTLDEGGLIQHGPSLTDQEEREALEAARRLDRADLSLLPGRAGFHGLVWEGGSLDMALTQPEKATGTTISQSAPLGDGGPKLLPYIEDSINLLDGLELNRRRRGEGLPPVNLLWPWGHGLRVQGVNLPIQRGAMMRLLSNSVRLEGLSRLFAVSHAKRFSAPLRVDWASIRAELRRGEPVVAILHPVAEMQRHGRIEEAAWFLGQIEKELLEPLILEQPEEAIRLTVLAPGGVLDPAPPPDRASAAGIGFNYDTRRPETSRLPWDERLLEEPAAGYPLHEAVLRGLMG